MRFEADSQERLDEVRSLIEDASRRAGLVIWEWNKAEATETRDI
jgi:hypothetical protein